MTNTLRLTLAALAFAALAGCTRSAEPPVLSDDLKQDLARAGAEDMGLAGTTAPRLEVVSAVERTDGAVAAPRAPARAKTQPLPKPPAKPSAPTPAPTSVPAPTQRRPQPPQPTTQKEPPGGWKSPGQVIRNAPFPINP